jgi:hypothetical protein
MLKGSAQATTPGEECGPVPFAASNLAFGHPLSALGLTLRHLHCANVGIEDWWHSAKPGYFKS